MEVEKLGNFKVIRKLGQGGMGIVYLAEDLVLGRLVALKVLAPNLTMDPDFMNRFRAEARHQARLTHPNITLLYAFQEEQGQAYLVMEFVDGENLEQRIIRQGRINPGESIAIFREVLDGLDYAHNQGLIHRDLKPSNLLLTTQKTVKIMDFGIALHLEDSQRLTRPQHIVGTPHYMAPEQIRGQALDFRTDIYSLGVTLFEMVTGRLPFDGDSDYEIKVAQVTVPPPSPRAFGYADITPLLEAVILRAMSKEPGARFATAREFRQGLEACTQEMIQIPALPELQLPSGTPEGRARLSSRSSPQTGRSWLPWLSVPVSLVAGALLAYYAGVFHKTTAKTGVPPPLARTTEPAAQSMATEGGKVNEATRPTEPLPTVNEVFQVKLPIGEDFSSALKKKLAQSGLGHLKLTMASNDTAVIRGQVRKGKDKEIIEALSREINPAVVLDLRKLQVIVAVKKKERPVAEEVEPMESPEPRVSPLRPAPASRPAPRTDPTDLQFRFGAPEIKKIK